jgi:hypothetical protein
MSWPGRFVRFLYDFLVGETPELFVGPIVAMAVVAALIVAGAPALVAAVALVATVMPVATLSLWLALRGAA